MVTVKNFVFCLSASNLAERQDVTGLLSIMTPEYIPGLFTFSVYFTLLGLEEGEHEIQLQFKDNAGIIVADTDVSALPYTMPESPIEIPKEYLGVNLAIMLQNVDIKHSGLYTIDIILDGNILESHDIFVKGKNEVK